MNELKGYRVRVTVDYPIWHYDEVSALDCAKKIAENSHTACKVIKAEIILIDKPDNRKLFPEEQ